LKPIYKKFKYDAINQIHQRFNNMSEVTIYHNPACGTSRKVLELIRNAGITPTIHLYLEKPLSKKTLKQLIKDMGIPARALLRKNDPYEQLGLSEDKWTEAQLIAAMATHPILINRPIVVTSLGTKLCRPAEVVLEILPTA